MAVSNDDRIDLFDGFALDLARGCVVRAGQSVHLRPQTYEVLKYFVEHRGHLISKDKLIEEVWQGRAVTDGSLVKCIEELREKLGPAAREHIRNVRGRGYIFEAGAEETEGGAALPAGVDQVDVFRVTVEEREESPDAAAPKALPPAVAARQSGGRSGRAFIAAAVVLVLVVAAAVVYRSLAGRAPGPAQIESIAVLPFVNDGGGEEVEYLSDGVTESLINSLSRLPRLSVKARSLVFRYKGKEVATPNRLATNFACPAASLPSSHLIWPFLIMCAASIPSIVRSAVWKERKHCIARHLLRIARWSCSMTLLRYFTRRSLQSGGRNFSLTEAAKASGYEACLSVPMVNGSLL